VFKYKIIPNEKPTIIQVTILKNKKNSFNIFHEMEKFFFKLFRTRTLRFFTIIKVVVLYIMAVLVFSKVKPSPSLIKNIYQMKHISLAVFNFKI